MKHLRNLPLLRAQCPQERTATGSRACPHVTCRHNLVGERIGLDKLLAKHASAIAKDVRQREVAREVKRLRKVWERVVAQGWLPAVETHELKPVDRAIRKLVAKLEDGVDGAAERDMERIAAAIAAAAMDGLHTCSLDFAEDDAMYVEEAGARVSNWDTIGPTMGVTGERLRQLYHEVAVAIRESEIDWELE